MTSGDFECGRRRAAEVDGDMRLLHGFHFGEALFEAIVLAVVIEGFGLGPDAAQDVQVFVGAGIAFVMRQVVAVAALFGVVATGDDVDGEATARIVVEGCQLARGERGGDEAWAMREHEVYFAGDAGRVGDGEERVGAGRMMRHEDAVEARGFVCAGELLHVFDVDDRTLR